MAASSIVRSWWRQGARRILLPAATALTLAGMTSWHAGDLPSPRRGAELLAAAMIWEAAVAVAIGQVRQRLGDARLSSSAGLAVAVLTASVPATAAMFTILILADDLPGSVPGFYVQSLLMGLVVAFARRGLCRSRPRTADPVRLEAQSPEPPGAVRPADRSLADAGADFLRRHAPTLAGRPLLALQAEDHYLRIHVDGASALVLLRLREAVGELGPDAGWQPHRSFWLAADAGGRAARRGQAWQIVLGGGLCVPVSKAAVPAMRAAGYAETRDKNAPPGRIRPEP